MSSFFSRDRTNVPVHLATEAQRLANVDLLEFARRGRQKARCFVDQMLNAYQEAKIHITIVG